MSRSLLELISSEKRARDSHLDVLAMIAEILNTMGRAVLHWDDLSRQRRALGRLDDRLLQDIGKSRAEADRESRR